MITKTDDTIDSDVDQKHIMWDMKLKIDEPNDSGVIMDDENYSLKSPENGSIEIILETFPFSETRDLS